MIVKVWIIRDPRSRCFCRHSRAFHLGYGDRNRHWLGLALHNVGRLLHRTAALCADCVADQQKSTAPLASKKLMASFWQ